MPIAQNLAVIDLRDQGKLAATNQLTRKRVQCGVR
jgi:hypothetical protein